MPWTPRETVTGRYHAEVKEENDKKYPRDLETEVITSRQGQSLCRGGDGVTSVEERMGSNQLPVI